MVAIISDQKPGRHALIRFEFVCSKVFMTLED
jgi:hypothetical protein